MEKTGTKRAKRKILQITYPAPYSQSWNPDVLPVLMKNSVGRSTSLFHRSRRPLQSPRAWSQQFPDRPDPTAPHLKYGVFHNRRGSAPRPIPKRLPMPEKQVKPNIKPGHVIKVPQVLISKKNSTQAAQKKPERKKSKSQFPPVFMIRSMDKNNSRQLSQSKIMHMDIKPKMIASLSPSFCPSPNFRFLARKLSPRRFRLDPAERGVSVTRAK